MGGRKRKGNFGEKKNGCGYQKASAHLLRVLSEFLKALREGGSSRSSVTPPIIKIEPYWVREMSDTETAWNKALTGLQQTPFCMTTNTSLGVLTVGNLRGGIPKCPLLSFHCHPLCGCKCYLLHPACSSSTAGWNQGPQTAWPAESCCCWGNGWQRRQPPRKWCGADWWYPAEQGRKRRIFTNSFYVREISSPSFKGPLSAQRQKHTFSAHSGKNSYRYAVLKLCAFKLSIINLMQARNLKMSLRQQ